MMYLYIIYGITFRILWKNQEYFLLAKKTCYLIQFPVQVWSFALIFVPFKVILLRRDPWNISMGHSNISRFPLLDHADGDMILDTFTSSVSNTQ